MTTLTTRVWWALRVGAAACFIGHGAFGVLTKAAWLPFFGLFGIGNELAYTLMPVVGTVDILVGVSMLLRPTKAVMLYMTVWGAGTALLRPMTGDYFSEFLERAGNYGVPLALLLMTQWPRSLREWIARAKPLAVDDLVLRNVVVILVVTSSVLLAGHGILGLAGKPLLQSHWAALGFEDPLRTAMAIGRVELFFALLLVLRPSAALAGGILSWKLATESLFLLTGDPAWEFIERGGSYAAPLALLFIARVYRLPGLRFGAIAKGRLPAPTAV